MKYCVLSFVESGKSGALYKCPQFIDRTNCQTNLSLSVTLNHMYYAGFCKGTICTDVYLSFISTSSLNVLFDEIERTCSSFKNVF